ncbi:MAG TPA: pre-peptidase C-terminal domain-containing protein, partial [Brevundimonas sp.]
MFKTVLLATTALAVLAGSAIAQQALRPGAPVSGDLRRGDEQLDSGEFVDTWTFQGRAGDRVSLHMSSSDFDPYLLVNGPGDFSEENDDAEEGEATDAGLDLRLPATGTYRVMATSYEADEAGRYSLSMDIGGARGGSLAGQLGSRGPASSQRSAQNNLIEPGDTVRDSLERGDQTLDSGEFADAWRFRGRRGQTYTVSLDSSDFDPYLVVRGPGGLSEDNDDDPSQRGSSNSRVTFTLPADGEVTLSATSYESGESGRYALAVGEGGQVYGDTRNANGTYAQNLTRQPQRPGNQPASAPSTDAPITVGQTRDGRLGQGARTLPSGEYVNNFTLRGRRGQQLDLRLSSSEFDPYLQLNGPNGFSAFNDDDEDQDDSHDSRLIVTLPADGAYTIAATSYEASESGRYRLSVGDGSTYRPPAPPRPAPGQGPARPGGNNGGVMRIGDTVGGQLQRGDETLDSGEYVDTYSFQGTRGTRVAVELTSSAFDAYTILTTPSGEQIDNDDGEDGTNSRLDTVLSETGEYQVQVTSFAAAETGSYRFSVAPSQGSPRQAAVAGGPRVFAIMVGVSEYGDVADDLPYTDEDAEKLAETLQREGVLNASSVVLTNAEATVGGVRRAFEQVSRQAGPDDMFLFFFSGHGS